MKKLIFTLVLVFSLALVTSAVAAPPAPQALDVPNGPGGGIKP